MTLKADSLDSAKILTIGSDLQLSTTFLQVVSSGSFVGAADRLGVSQSAVSQRIQSLEARLGLMLFTRGRSGVRLTPAGQKFEHYALAMKQIWDQAQFELALPSGFSAQLRFGGHYSLWRHYLTRWLCWMRVHGPDCALRADAYGNETLIKMLDEGMLEIGVTFDPQHLAGFKIDLLFEESLVLVSTLPHGGPNDPNYLYVDWGPGFRRFHIESFPESALPAVQTNLGAFAVEFVVEHGGSGYFPEPVVRPYLAKRQLFEVADAPRFETPIYAVYHERKTNASIALALEGLRSVVH